MRRKQIVKSMKGEKEGGTEEGRVGGWGRTRSIASMDSYCLSVF